MNTPYNNGKIKIGQFYQRPAPVYEVDKDMSLLQTALIGDIKTIKRERMWNVVYVFTLVFGLFGLFLFGSN